jgi:hypothetical protein
MGLDNKLYPNTSHQYSVFGQIKQKMGHNKNIEMDNQLYPNK